jgi:hypothetical protein
VLECSIGGGADFWFGNLRRFFQNGQEKVETLEWRNLAIEDGNYQG